MTTTPDRSTAAAIIARCFDYLPHIAAQIVAILSEDELELVESANHDAKGPVRVATVIYLARRREAAAIREPALRRRAILDAGAEASRHMRAIEQIVPLAPPEEISRREADWPGIRVVPTPDLP